ncbi:hypothetical protein QR685DRAFT_597684 [Neurospora intermedia]|uniref:Uncharacterized protein n=1 Tax=Neurospora intermedia TaxID=5142 RepID=A0ABR3DET9_NEUIN
MQEPLGLGDEGGGSGSAWVVIGRVTTSLPAAQRSKPTDDASHCLVAVPVFTPTTPSIFTKFHSIFRNDDDASQRSTLPVMIGLG